MILKCVATEPTLPQARRLGKHFIRGQEFPVEVGLTYTAFGLRVWGCGSWVDIESSAGYLVVVPLCLFRIIDGSVPSIWVTRVDEDGDMAILPEPFHDPYFIDDLSEGRELARAAFVAVKKQLEVPPPAWTPPPGGG